MFLTAMRGLYECLRFTPSSRDCGVVTRAVEEERDVFNMERSMRTLVIYPQQQRLW